MNYRPVISFREIRSHERELMKNAESILKELGFKFKATSPFRDDREWELLFSDDYSKEMYIQFKDDSDEEHSPIVIIDDILTDKLMTVSGDSGYYTESEISEEEFEEFSENYENEIKSLFDTESELIDHDTMFELFKDVAIDTEKNILLSQIAETSKIKSKNKKLAEILNILLVYLNDEEIMELTYQILDN